jgi:flagellar M-ring protein FliF
VAPKLDVGAAKERMGTLLSGFTVGQRVVLILAGIGIVAGGFFFTRWSSSTSYAPIYANLSADDAASVTSQLTGKGVPYKLDAGGTTVLVPRSQLYQLRIDLSAAGLPSKGSPGWALLDKQGITTSEFRQRVDYQRALEGELGNTIAAINGVAGADVHLVIPKDDVFSSDATKPSASVLITPTGATRLTSGQVQAVVNLVASSVEGLESDGVTVADSTGKVLSVKGTDLGASGDAHAEQQSGFETRLGDSIRTMLEPMVGPGHAIVRVSAKLDFDRRQTTTESFQKPTDGLALTESTSKETYLGAGTPGGGVLGPQGGSTTTVPGSTYSKESADRSFALGKVNEQVESAPGAVDRLTVAVLLDKATTKVQTRQVEDLVRAAAGLDDNRGDQVQVTTADFDTSPVKEAQKAKQEAVSAQRTSQIFDIARAFGAVLLLAAILFFGYRSARTATVNRVPIGVPVLSLAQYQSDLATGGPGAALALSAAIGGNHLAGPSGAAITALNPAFAHLGQLGMGAAAGGVAVAEVDAESAEPARPKKAPPPPVKSISDQANELVSTQPDDVAQMLRGWLGDRRS